MRVLFATTQFYLPQSAGGSESSTHDLCYELSKRDINNFAVLAALRPCKGKVWLVNRLKSKIMNQSHPIDTVMGYPVFRGWSACDGVASVIKRFCPDLAIIQAGQPLVLSREFISRNVKTVVYLRDVAFADHGNGGDYQPHPLLHFIANSHFTSNAFLKRYHISSKVIPPLVRTENYRVEKNGDKVLFICPRPQKGVQLALKLAEANPDIPFLFVESWVIPEDEKQLLFKRAKISGNIEWLESQSDMKKVYAQAKLLLVPSLCEEAWGRVVTETQVSGIPTLASDRGGLPESVGVGGICLDPETDFDKWNNYLKRFLFDDVFYQYYSKLAKNNADRDAIQPVFLISEFIDFISKI